MLTDFQRRIARTILAAGIDPDLALAGGGALISLGLVPRSTLDLDFFTTEPRVEQLLDAIVEVLDQEGLSVEPDRSGPTFGRLTVSAGDERCRVDVAQDARLWPTQDGPLGRTVGADELAADKTLALFTRAEPRDYVDVYFLAQHFSKERLLALAHEKDAGFDEAVFADMLGAIRRLDREEFEVGDEVLERIRGFVEEWRAELREHR